MAVAKRSNKSNANVAKYARRLMNLRGKQHYNLQQSTPELEKQL